MARPIGIVSSVSHTRTSKSVPIRTTRSGRSGPPQRGSKMRARSARSRRILDVARARPAAAHVGERRLLLAGIGEGETGEPARRSPSPAPCRTARGGNRSGSVRPSPPRLPFARRHRLVGDEQIVQAAGPGQPDLVGGVEHARGIAQQRARMIERDRLQEGLRRQAGPAAEQVMQLAGRHADGRRRWPRSRAASRQCSEM